MTLVPERPPTVMISCGEPSGDLYAGALVRELAGLAPGLHAFGLGGERLRSAGATLLADYHGLTVTGLVEVLRVLPRSWATYRALVAEARNRRPDVLVVIDFPDFHFRLAPAVRRLGVPVVYYIPPQLWAWRPGRLRVMRRWLDHTLVIFPFEPPIYEKAGIPVEFVGHPLVDLATAAESRRPFLERLGLAPDAPTVALLPGSRPNELREMLPGLVGAAKIIASRLPGSQFVVARAPGLRDGLFAPLTDARGLRLLSVDGRTDDVLAAADVAITASGTATVQTAIHGTPMVVVYRLAPLTYRLFRPFVRVDAYAMVNLVAGRKVARELIQDDFTPDAVASETLRLLTDRELAAEARRALGEVRERLGAGGASRRAAEAVLRVAASGSASQR